MAKNYKDSVCPVQSSTNAQTSSNVNVFVDIFLICGNKKYASSWAQAWDCSPGRIQLFLNRIWRGGELVEQLRGNGEAIAPFDKNWTMMASQFYRNMPEQQHNKTATIIMSRLKKSERRSHSSPVTSHPSIHPHLTYPRVEQSRPVLRKESTP